MMNFKFHKKTRLKRKNFFFSPRTTKNVVWNSKRRICRYQYWEDSDKSERSPTTRKPSSSTFCALAVHWALCHNNLFDSFVDVSAIDRGQNRHGLLELECVKFAKLYRSNVAVRDQSKYRDVRVLSESKGTASYGSPGYHFFGQRGSHSFQRRIQDRQYGSAKRRPTRDSLQFGRLRSLFAAEYMEFFLFEKNQNKWMPQRSMPYIYCQCYKRPLGIVCNGYFYQLAQQMVLRCYCRIFYSLFSNSLWSSVAF